MNKKNLNIKIIIFNLSIPQVVYMKLNYKFQYKISKTMRFGFSVAFFSVFARVGFTDKRNT